MEKVKLVLKLFSLYFLFFLPLFYGFLQSTTYIDNF